MVLPIFAGLYIFDRDLFVDPDQTLAHGKLMPKDGVPAALTEFYELNAIQWNVFDYIYGTKEAGISMTHFILIYIWAWTQLMWTAVMDPFCIVYGFFVAYAMGSILMYEYYILGNTWDARAPVEVVPQTESPSLEDEEDSLSSEEGEEEIVTS